MTTKILLNVNMYIHAQYANLKEFKYKNPNI